MGKHQTDEILSLQISNTYLITLKSFNSACVVLSKISGEYMATAAKTVILGKNAKITFGDWLLQTASAKCKQQIGAAGLF